jgi:hypothetical protein
MKFALSLLIGATLLAENAEALEWRWSYRGEGVAASGAFTTKNAPNADGFYEITGIRGEANGVTITDLQPAGASIPGNDGYPVDNLVRTEDPAHHAWLRLRARQRDLRQTLLRGPFRQAGHLRVFLRPGETPHQRTRGDVHRDDCALEDKA